MHSFIFSNFADKTIFSDILKHEHLQLSEDAVKHHPDFIVIKPQQNTKTKTSSLSIKIDVIRNLQQQLVHNPFTLPFHIVLIKNANMMTIAAQQAFLKLLEEPPTETRFYLVTNHYQQLLLTIQSRCQLINAREKTQELNYEQFEEIAKTIAELSAMTIIKRMSTLEKIAKDKVAIQTWLHDCIFSVRQQVLIQPTQKQKILLENIQQALNDLESNINLKLTIDNLAIHWDRTTSSLDFPK